MTLFVCQSIHTFTQDFFVCWVLFYFFGWGELVFVSLFFGGGGWGWVCAFFLRDSCLFYLIFIFFLGGGRGGTYYYLFNIHSFTQFLGEM